ncbi:hypothetical protein C9374_002754 [Naegleria lovaniensis]|uniref:WD40 domain-containing protein n=1 Tax=Naegleria lovaniensis TaxID=51637 RepID=A0AA88GUN4_NAELO|nr:uncharacterized protein C9374_002754 [Naegleria lovaniensis]KAG2386308.1 hypothetical protein C9374_002754 [Naegleria lovaniensis]
MKKASFLENWLSTNNPSPLFTKKKVIKENHKQEINYLKRHPTTEGIFLSASTNGKQIHLYNNNHCESHLDLVSHYLHDDEIGDVCWVSEKYIGFHDCKGRIFIISVMQSRVETMIDLFPNFNEMCDDDENIGINRMYSSFEHFTSEIGQNYIALICNEFKTLQVWDVETNSCVCTVTDEDALFIHICPVFSCNKFLIFQCNGSVLLLTVESESITLDPVHIDHNGRENLFEQVCDHTNGSLFTRQIIFQDHVLLVIKTAHSVMLYSLWSSETNSIQLNYLSHVEILDKTSINSRNFDLLSNKEKDEFLIIVPEDKDLCVIRVFKTPSLRLEMVNSIKLNRKGSPSLQNCLLFNAGDIIIASSSADSSILRWEMNDETNHLLH